MKDTTRRAMDETAAVFNAASQVINIGALALLSWIQVGFQLAGAGLERFHAIMEYDAEKVESLRTEGGDANDGVEGQRQ